MPWFYPFENQLNPPIAIIQQAEGNPSIAFYLILFVLSLGFGLVGTPAVRRLAEMAGVVDAPSARKIHVAPVPLLGGAAIYLAFIITVTVLSYYALPFKYVLQLGALILGASLMFFIGLLDDKWGLSPRLKLGGQLMAALWLVISDVKIEVFAVPALNILFTFAWVIVITNSINFLDNMDGLSAGVATIASLFFFLTAYLSGQWLVAAMGISLAGAAAGFVYHNFGIIKQGKPIFMGDSGALFMGYLLAAIGIKLRFNNTSFVTWMVPVLILGIPLFDFSLVVFSRLRRRLSPLRGGKDHSSHRLVALGLTKREAVLVIYLMCGALGVAALIVTGATVTDGYMVGGLVAVLAGWIFIKLEHIPLVDTNPKLQVYSKNPRPQANPAIGNPENSTLPGVETINKLK